jgi:hypothetical protein
MEAYGGVDGQFVMSAEFLSFSLCFKPSTVAQSIRLLTFIQDITDSNPGQDTEHPEVSSGFSQFLQSNSGIISQITLQPFPYLSFPFNCLLIALPFVAKYCEMLRM